MKYYVYRIKYKKTIGYYLWYDLWNLAEDICASFDQDLEKLISDRETSALYEKIFWGNNFPALTPLGKEYIPIFNKKERLALNKLHEKLQAVVVSKL